MSAITKKDINDLETRLVTKIDEQGDLFSRELHIQGDLFRKELEEQGDRFDKKLEEQGDRFDKKMEEQSTRFDKKMQEQSDRFDKKMEEQSTVLRSEIKNSTDSVLEVIAQMAETTHKQLSGIRDELDEIRIDLGMMKRELNNLNSDIDKAFKNKSITEEETVALIAGQKRLERWIEQIAQETGVKLAV